MNKVLIKRETNLSFEEFREILINSTLGERRPINDLDRLRTMCENANLIVTARLEDKLIGVARSVTDFVYCTYLSDLAVDKEFQKKGIGKRLIEETRKQSPQATLILLSAPAAVEYYPKIGMKKHNHCFIISELEELK